VAGEKQDNVWPLPKFYFLVDITGVGTDLPFQEIYGLDIEAQPIEYLAGNIKAFSTNKTPGIVQPGSVILKKGLFAKDNNFWKWYSQIKLNTIERTTVTIKLLDESGIPVMTWTLANAWPTKITGTDLKSDGNEVAVETLEIAYEGLTIANG
jgi:phage tail-like protein